MWDQELIRRGNALMNIAAYGDTLTTYHIEAAIAYDHCVATTYDNTNWKQILTYYDILMRMQPDPIVMLNRLTVWYKLFGPDSTMREIETSPYKSVWEKNYLYHSLLGDLNAPSNPALAVKHFTEAIQLTRSHVEKKLLIKKIENL